jgi:hypothetical protein
LEESRSSRQSTNASDHPTSETTRQTDVAHNLPGFEEILIARDRPDRRHRQSGHTNRDRDGDHGRRNGRSDPNSSRDCGGSGTDCDRGSGKDGH